MIEQELKALNLPYIMTKNGQEAWSTLQDLAADCRAKGVPVTDRVAVVLSDLEMPEMDGFTLTRSIKGDPALRTIPVIIHSSLTGDTNEQHVQRAGADGYVAKFAAKELAETLRAGCWPRRPRRRDPPLGISPGTVQGQGASMTTRRGRGRIGKALPAAPLPAARARASAHRPRAVLRGAGFVHHLAAAAVAHRQRQLTHIMGRGAPAAGRAT